MRCTWWVSGTLVNCMIVQKKSESALLHLGRAKSPGSVKSKDYAILTLDYEITHSDQALKPIPRCFTALMHVSMIKSEYNAT